MLMLRVVQNDGLSLGEIVRELPHDLPAFIVYALILAFVWLIWRGSRGKPQV